MSKKISTKSTNSLRNTEVRTEVVMQETIQAMVTMKQILQMKWEKRDYLQQVLEPILLFLF